MAESNSKYKIETANGGVDKNQTAPDINYKLDLPVNLEDLEVENTVVNAPAESQSKGPSKDYTGKSSGNMGPGGSFAADGIHVNGTFYTRDKAVNIIKKEVTERIEGLKKELIKSAKFGHKFDAQVYKEKFDLLRRLTNFFSHFMLTFKKMALERLKHLFEAVVIHKKEPVID